MNQKKSKKILMILIIMVLIILLVGGIVFTYLTTDLLKSNKEMFFKYLIQMGETENGWIENDLKQYFERKENTPYKDEGNFLVKVTSEENQSKYENINHFNLSFSGQVDQTNSKSMQEISLNYSDSVKFPITYKQIENKIGLQTKYVGNKFIVAETNQLNKLEENADKTIKNALNGALKIQELTQIEFKAEEKQHIQDNYLKILNEKLNENQFIKITEQGLNGYQLTLEGKDIKDIATKLLETLKNDETTLEKINEYIKIQNNSAKITEKDIDSAINTLQNDSKLNGEKIKITVYTQKRKTSQVTVETNKMKIEMAKQANQDKIQYLNSFEEALESGKTIKISLRANYSDVKNGQSAKEDYELGIETENIKCQYQFNLSTNFVDNISVEEFTDENAMILTKYEPEQITNFLDAVRERIIQVNEEQMQELGIEVNENPIQQILLLQNSLYPKSTNFSSQTDVIDELEIIAFNQKFELYQSTNLQGTTVRGLFTTIALNNGINSTDDNTMEQETNSSENNTNYKIKEIHYNGEEYEVNKQNIAAIKAEVEAESFYRVEFEKEEDTGLIYRVVINKK